MSVDASPPSLGALDVQGEGELFRDFREGDRGALEGLEG